MSQWASLREQGLLAFVYQTETTQVILLLWFHAVPLTSSKVKSLIKQLIFKILSRMAASVLSITTLNCFSCDRGGGSISCYLEVSCMNSF